MGVVKNIIFGSRHFKIKPNLGQVNLWVTSLGFFFWQIPWKSLEISFVDLVDTLIVCGCWMKYALSFRYIFLFLYRFSLKIKNISIENLDKFSVLLLSLKNFNVIQFIFQVQIDPYLSDSMCEVCRAAQGL